MQSSGNRSERKGIREEAEQIQGEATKPVSTGHTDRLLTLSSERTRGLWHHRETHGDGKGDQFHFSSFLFPSFHWSKVSSVETFHFRVALGRVEKKSGAPGAKEVKGERCAEHER